MNWSRGFSGGGPAALVAAAVAVALLVAGCGGDDSSDQDVDQPQPLGPPQAKESVKQAQERLVKAVESPHCQGLKGLIPLHRETDPKALCKTLSFQLGGATPAGAEEYRGGAVIDFARQGQSIPAVLVLEQDGRFYLSNVDPYVDRPTADTKPSKTIDQAALDAVDALASGDCARVREATDPQRGIGTAPKKVLCDYAKQNPIKNIRTIDPQAKAVPLGANATYGFFGIGTQAVHYTMVLGRRPQGEDAGGQGALSEYAYIDAFQTNTAAAGGSG